MYASFDNCLPRILLIIWFEPCVFCHLFFLSSSPWGHKESDTTDHTCFQSAHPSLALLRPRQNKKRDQNRLLPGVQKLPEVYALSRATGCIAPAYLTGARDAIGFASYARATLSSTMDSSHRWLFKFMLINITNTDKGRRDPP